MNPVRSQPPRSPLLTEVIQSESDSPAVKKQKLNEEDGDCDSMNPVRSPSPSLIQKQKVNEEDGDSDSMDYESEDIMTPRSVTCTDYDSDEDYFPDDPDRIALWERYFQQIDESEGFDIKEYPSCCPMATIFPMPFYLEDPDNVKRLKGYTELALEKYNKEKRTSYKVKDLLKVNGGGCQDFVFYITLTVKTGDGNDDKVYFQAKVVRHLNMSLDFPIVRPRAKGDLDLW